MSGPGKAVINGVWRFGSVTQLEMFDPHTYGGCPTKWWMQYVAWMPKGDPTDAMLIGGRVAKELEAYAKGGPVSKLSRLARKALPFVPEIGPDLMPELPIDGFLSVHGIPFIGAADLVHRRGVYIGADYELRTDPPNTAECTDYKTAKNLETAKTAIQVTDALQMLGYGVALGNKWPDIERVRLGHICLPKSKEEAQKVSSLVDLTVIRDRWHKKTDLTVKAMIDVAKESDPTKIDKNVQHCEAYNRPCPFLDVCDRSKKLKLTPEEQALLNEFMGTAPVETPAPAPKSREPITDGPGWKMVTCSVCGTDLGKRPPGHTIDSSLCPKKDSHPLVAKTPDEAPLIVPPDAPKSNPELAVACPHCPPGSKNFQHLLADCPTLAGELATKLAASLAAAAKPNADAPPTDEAAAQEPAPAKAKRGPRAKRLVLEDTPEELAAKAATAVPPQPTEAPTAPAPAAEETRTVVIPTPTKADEVVTVAINGIVTAPAPAGFRLFVNCRPGPGVVAQPLEPYVSTIAAALARAHGAADIRATDSKELGFQKWRGALVAAFRATPPAPGCYSLETRDSDFAPLAVEALAPLCAPGYPVKGF